jgi:hypothetical protein
MHRFMLDHPTQFPDPDSLPEGIYFIPGGTACEGTWFTNGPVAVWDFTNPVRTFASMAEVQEAYPDLELRWLDGDEYWDAQELAVRSALRGWTYEGAELTLSPIVDNVN